MSSNQFINSNGNVRVVVPAASLTRNGTSVRLTFSCPTSSGAYPIEHCYIGHADQSVNPWNFDGTQVPVTFNGGILGVTLPLNGTPIVSDPITYNLDHTKPFIVATHGNFSAGDTVRTAVVTGVSSYVHTAADETSVSVVTGYSGSTNTVMSINLIEGCTGAAVACDPYFGNVVLLMGYEGPNNSTGAPGMTDESPAAHGTATTNGGSVSIVTGQFKFGTSSLNLGGGSDIQFPDSNDFYFGSGNYTIELWVRHSNVAGQQAYVGQWQSAGNYSYLLSTTSTALTLNVSTDGTNNFAISGSWSPVINTWYHIAVDWDGVKTRLYVNGAMIGSDTTARTFFNSPNNFSIGSTSLDNAVWFNGWMDELRITKGVARYASDSGFAVPTAAFPRVACSTLCAFDSSTAISTTVSNGGLTATSVGVITSGNQGVQVYAVEAKSTGKYYYEMTVNVRTANVSTGHDFIGIYQSGTYSSFVGVTLAANGNMADINGFFASTGITVSAGNIIGIAVDMTNKSVWIKRVGGGTVTNWNGNVSADPVANVGGGAAPATGSVVPFVTFGGTGGASGDQFTINMGPSSGFTGAVPSGYTAWCP